LAIIAFEDRCSSFPSRFAHWYLLCAPDSTLSLYDFRSRASSAAEYGRPSGKVEGGLSFLEAALAFLGADAPALAATSAELLLVHGCVLWEDTLSVSHAGGAIRATLCFFSAKFTSGMSSRLSESGSLIRNRFFDTNGTSSPRELDVALMRDGCEEIIALGVATILSMRFCRGEVLF
jgi:hypothetical protein